MSRAFAAAWLKSTKNSRFCGVSRIGMDAVFYHLFTGSTRGGVQSFAAVATDATADERRSLTVRSRGLVYGAAAALFVVALVLAALRAAEQPGRLSGWQGLVVGVPPGGT